MYVLISDATSVLWSDKRVFLFVQEFCSHCPVCQLKQAQTTRPPLQPIIETDFLNRIQVDLIDMHCATAFSMQSCAESAYQPYADGYR